MTETRNGDTRPRTDEPLRTDAPILRDVDHTHPHTNRSFGTTSTYARGVLVAADGSLDQRRSGPRQSRTSTDGGRPDVVPEDEEEPSADDDVETLRDVEHTPPNDSEDANRVFARGGEDDREEDE